MSANKNPYFESIADAVRYLEENRELIYAYQDNEAREAYRRQRERLLQEQDARIAELDLTIQEKDACIAELDRIIQEKDFSIQENNRAIQKKELTIQKNSACIAELEKALAEKQ